MNVRVHRCLLVLLILGAGLSGESSEAPVLKLRPAGHPRSRFPLAVSVAAAPRPTLDKAVRDAVNDWNELFAALFGLPAFSLRESEDGAQVFLTFVSDESSRLMGLTELDVDDAGVIQLPVRISLNVRASRGRISPERLLFQVAAHELGHALGLPHLNEPESLMCCDRRALDFSDPETREAYVAARRRPSVRSVEPQLSSHYRRFWERAP